MATLTVAGVEEALSKFKSVGSSFTQELNLVLPRLYAMGMWRDLLYETTISTTDGNFTLPDDAESIVSALIDNDPARAKSQFHDYRITGRNKDGTTLDQFGLVDDGFVPAINELDSSKSYSIHVEPIKPETTIPRTSSNFITVTGLNNSTTPETIEYTASFDTASSGVSSSSLFTKITEIRNGDSSLPNPVKISAVNSTDATDKLELATVQEANKVNSYRRYRIGNDPSNTIKKTIRVLVKRKFKTLINSYDVVRPSNLNAIKHALLGSVAEENADLERANYHWNVCRQLLDEELDAYRGEAKPVLRFDPSGSGSRIPNIV
tara:strand:- start:359 stop:1321 length:963 start_codon:yes stop_codon:yes gene_type:complete